jgi:hypothetical protein
MSHVLPDQAAQADAYRTLLASFVDEPWFAGFFVWRLYADPTTCRKKPSGGFPRAASRRSSCFATPSAHTVREMARGRWAARCGAKRVASAGSDGQWLSAERPARLIS